jgi:lipoprotein signal peptidase
MTLLAGRSYRWLFWSLALIGLLVDQTSKYTVFHVLYQANADDREVFAGKRVELLAGKFELSTQYQNHDAPGEGVLGWFRSLGCDKTPYVNTGALFGMGRNANLLFAIVSVAAATAILAWSTRPGTARDRLLSVALGLILAGTLGNLYDRLVFGGVRDFLHWDYLVDWPVFNLADCWLVVGAFLLLIQAFAHRPEARTARPAAALPGMEVAEAK